MVSFEASGDGAALETFQAAVDLLTPGAGQLEAARGHRGLAQALLADGRREAAQAQLTRAAAAYEALGRPDAAELQELVAILDLGGEGGAEGA